jgi:hypothetical protein
MYVLYKFEVNDSFHVATKRDWDEWTQKHPDDKAYTKVAEHEDVDLLKKMAQLANEGDK